MSGTDCEACGAFDAFSGSAFRCRDCGHVRCYAEAELQGPPEEIGTGIYRLVDGEVTDGGGPEDLSNY